MRMMILAGVDFYVIVSEIATVKYYLILNQYVVDHFPSCDTC